MSTKWVFILVSAYMTVVLSAAVPDVSVEENTDHESDALSDLLQPDSLAKDIYFPYYPYAPFYPYNPQNPQYPQYPYTSYNYIGYGDGTVGRPPISPGLQGLIPIPGAVPPPPLGVPGAPPQGPPPPGEVQGQLEPAVPLILDTPVAPETH